MFHASADSIDDLMRAVFKQLLSRRGNLVVESKKGKSTEIFGALLELKNPRARLSRSFSRAKAFSPLGELCWYLSGGNSVKFIEYYISIYPKFSNDGKKANGAYGPRIFGDGAEAKRANQSNWDRVIRTLRKGTGGSRNAIIQIFSNDDAWDDNKDKPCTCTLQFAIRRGQLLMHTHMRSNDALLGLPHDIFSFTMLQEIAARELGVGLGPYTHSVTSLHLYHDKPATKDEPAVTSTSDAHAYYDEGLHDFVPMPEMPIGNPWASIERVLAAEEGIRLGKTSQVANDGLDPYWTDLVDLLRIYSIFKELSDKRADDPFVRTKHKEIIAIMRQMSSKAYKIYIMDKLQKKLRPMRDLFDMA